MLLDASSASAKAAFGGIKADSNAAWVLEATAGSPIQPGRPKDRRSSRGMVARRCGSAAGVDGCGYRSDSA